jgi:hypothetical protein
MAWYLIYARVTSSWRGTYFKQWLRLNGVVLNLSKVYVFMAWDLVKHEDKFTFLS